VRRGDQVEARYRDYRGRLERFYTRLANEVRVDAPDLHARLTEAPPTLLPHGYQIVPKIVADNAPRQDRVPRAVASTYSWPRTEGFVERDVGRLVRLETTLVAASGLEPADRRRSWETVTKDYLDLAKRQRLIESSIQYNRLWQGEIYRRPALYDTFTVLYDAMMERQALLDSFREAHGLPDPALLERERQLSRQIRDSDQKVALPPFARVAHPDPHRWIITVPISTDIRDREFVEAFRAGIEQTWRVEDGADSFRVVVEIRPVPPTQLYAPAAPPAAGEPVDLWKHGGRFPRDAAVLTTGATLTHVGPHWAIHLGPHDIQPRTLAHEFGHILGLQDGYFRGYRSLGADGYEVLEVVPDLSDVMSSPGFGRVQRQHFDRLLGR
jgi:hypothetical protein